MDSGVYEIGRIFLLVNKWETLVGELSIQYENSEKLKLRKCGLDPSQQLHSVMV